MLTHIYGIKMVLISTSFLMVRQPPRNDCFQALCPQWESQLPPASLGGSPRSESVSNSSSFQVTASALGFGMYEVLCAPFKCWVSVSYSPLALLYTSPTGLENQMFEGLIFLVQDPWAGEPDEWLRPLTPLREPLQL